MQPILKTLEDITFIINYVGPSRTTRRRMNLPPDVMYRDLLGIVCEKLNRDPKRHQMKLVLPFLWIRVPMGVADAMGEHPCDLLLKKRGRSRPPPQEPRGVCPKGCKQVIPVYARAFRLGIVSAVMSVFYGLVTGLQIFLLAHNYAYRIRPTFGRRTASDAPLWLDWCVKQDLFAMGVSV